MKGTTYHISKYFNLQRYGNNSALLVMQVFVGLLT